MTYTFRFAGSDWRKAVFRWIIMTRLGRNVAIEIKIRIPTGEHIQNSVLTIYLSLSSLPWVAIIAFNLKVESSFKFYVAYRDLKWVGISQHMLKIDNLNIFSDFSFCSIWYAFTSGNWSNSCAWFRGNGLFPKMFIFCLTLVAHHWVD